MTGFACTEGSQRKSTPVPLIRGWERHSMKRACSYWIKWGEIRCTEQNRLGPGCRRRKPSSISFCSEGVRNPSIARGSHDARSGTWSVLVMHSAPFGRVKIAALPPTEDVTKWRRHDHRPESQRTSNPRSHRENYLPDQ